MFDVCCCSLCLMVVVGCCRCLFHRYSLWFAGVRWCLLWFVVDYFGVLRVARSCCSLFAVGCGVLCVVRCALLLFVVCCVLVVVCRLWLVVVYCVLFVVRCWCLLFVACCLMRVVRCRLLCVVVV